MLGKHAGSDPVAELLALDQSFSARTRSGATLVALPVDYLAWTGTVERADRRRGGRIVIAGAVSPMAARGLAQRGWRVQADVGLARK